MPIRSDRTGQRFGSLIAIRPAPELARYSQQGTWWLCKCDCGNEVAVHTSPLGSGHTRSCGCLRMGPGRGYRSGEAAFNLVLRTYQDNARKRGLPWELTKADFERITSRECFYCGTPPCTIGKAGLGGSGQWVYNGIDRLDNSQGYVLENVVPCCKTCNHAKKDLTFDEFMAWIARLTEYHWFHPDVMPSRLLAR